MKAAVLFAIKVFLFYLLVDLLSFSLVYYIFGTEFSLRFILLVSAVSAFPLTCYHVFQHIRAVKKLHVGDLKKEYFKVHQTLTIQLPLTSEQVLAKLQTNLPGKEWEIAQGSNAIKLKTNFSRKSIGENILIKVNRQNDNLSEVFIESRPINPLTVWDFGKNQENIIYLHKLLAA